MLLKRKTDVKQSNTPIRSSLSFDNAKQSYPRLDKHAYKRYTKDVRIETYITPPRKIIITIPKTQINK